MAWFLGQWHRKKCPTDRKSVHYSGPHGCSDCCSSLVDTFGYKGIPWFTTGVPLRESKRASIVTPKVESSKFDQSVCLLYHKEAVYNFIGRMDSSKWKNKLSRHFRLICQWSIHCLEYRPWSAWVCIGNLLKIAKPVMSCQNPSCHEKKCMKMTWEFIFRLGRVHSTYKIIYGFLMI